MPPPLTVMSVMDFRVLSPADPAVGQRRVVLLFCRRTMRVPGWGSSVSRTCMGMSFSESWATVGGKTTLAPK